MTLLAPIAPVAAQVQSAASDTQLAADVGWPNFGASAIGAVGFPGILASSGNTEPLPIASITKIITSLVILNSKPLTVGEPGPTITFTAKDAALVQAYAARNGETKPVRAGMTLSQLQVNEVMLVASANNYAESYSTWAFGSQAGVPRRGAKLAGCSRAGPHDPARQLRDESGQQEHGERPRRPRQARPGQSRRRGHRFHQERDNPERGRDQELQQAARPRRESTESRRARWTRREPASCSRPSSRSAGHSGHLVGVALGGVDHPSLDAAVQSLIATAKTGFHSVTLAKAGQSFASYSTPWKSKAHAVATKSESVLVWSDTPIAVKVTTTEVGLARAGEHRRLRQCSRRERRRSPCRSRSRRAIDDPGALWRLSNPFGLLD